jgi:hypothetical protein
VTEQRAVQLDLAARTKFAKPHERITETRSLLLSFDEPVATPDNTVGALDWMSREDLLEVG